MGTVSWISKEKVHFTDVKYFKQAPKCLFPPTQNIPRKLDSCDLLEDLWGLLLFYIDLHGIRSKNPHLDGNCKPAQSGGRKQHHLCQSKVSWVSTCLRRQEGCGWTLYTCFTRELTAGSQTNSFCSPSWHSQATGRDCPWSLVLFCSLAGWAFLFFACTQGEQQAHRERDKSESW